MSIPNRISGTEAEPLRKRTVLSHLLGENSLGAERLLRRLQNEPHAGALSYHVSFTLNKS